MYVSFESGNATLWILLRCKNNSHVEFLSALILGTNHRAELNIFLHLVHTFCNVSVSLQYNATRTEEQISGVHGYDGEPLLKWFVPQCLVDQHAGNAASYACRLAMVFDANLDHQTLTFKFPEDLVVSFCCYK